MKRVLFLLAAALLCAVSTEAQPPVDWAYFNCFEAVNPTTPHHAKVLFMGDSITEGWIAKHPQFFSDNGYISRGISGQTTSQMLVRFRADVLELEPQIVVILGGTNDIAQNMGNIISFDHMLDNIQSMIDLARAHGIFPVLTSVLPAGDYSWHPGLEPAGKIVEFNRMLRDYAESEGILYVDYHSSMVAADGSLIAGYTYDGVHPNEAGYDVMESIIQPVLEQIKLPKMKRKIRK